MNHSGIVLIIMLAPIAIISKNIFFPENTKESESGGDEIASISSFNDPKPPGMSNLIVTFTIGQP